MPRSLRSASVPLPSSQTNGLNTRERNIMGPAMAEAMRSGSCSAIRLGTNSPTSSVSTVMSTTMMTKASVSA